jgi:serine/threonine protein kinase
MAAPDSPPTSSVPQLPASGVATLRPNDPASVGVFTLVARIGEGGMGVVYLGREPDGSLVAVKVVRDELAGQVEFRARFSREVRAMKGVRGPRTANLIAANVRDTPQWVVMDYIPGPNLAERLQGTAGLGAEGVGEFVLGLAQGVDAIHRAGVVHRDLKPSNVIVARSGPVILDYGIARALDATSVTMTGSRVGSLVWMSPEQLLGPGEDRPCDVHAFGLLAYFAATGEHPFGTGRPEAVAWRISNSEPRLTPYPQVPGLDELVRACLRSEPERRPTASEVLARAETLMPG